MELLLCSLGYSPARTATLQVLQALRRCGVVYCDALTPRLLRLLRLFCPDCRPLPARDPGAQGLRRCADRILAAAGRRGAVGYAAFGQPMIFGELARELCRGAKARGAALSVFGGLSAFDFLLAANREVLGYEFSWYQVLEDCRPQALALTGTLDRRLPTAAYLKSGSPRAAWEGVVRSVSASYPAERACVVFEVSEEGERRRLRRLSVGRLAEAAGTFKRPCFVVVSPEGHGSR